MAILRAGYRWRWNTNQQKTLHDQPAQALVQYKGLPQDIFAKLITDNSSMHTWRCKKHAEPTKAIATGRALTTRLGRARAAEQTKEATRQKT
eukprot:356411-Amphidinium_carterae.1